jgi:hypothetical protein
MPDYPIESTPEYQAARKQFIVANGREPNDLDKMEITEQLKLAALWRLEHRLQAMLCELHAVLTSDEGGEA